MASYNTVITNEGAALLASVIANQGTLTFSEMRFSTNDYDGVEATLTVGTFAGTFITAAAAGSVVDATTIKVAAQFDNSGIVGDHPLYSIGIVGTDGNTTALIAVCTTTNPDIIRAALTGVSTYAFNVNLAVSSTSDITVTGTTAAVLYDTDVIDNLTSAATNKPLSANQGRVLKGNIDDNFSGQSNENLLDNSWFTVNQRGQTNYTGSVYTVDRWKLDYAGTLSNVDVTSSGVKINNLNSYTFLEQKFENITPLINRQVTASILLSDGTIQSGTGVYDGVNTINLLPTTGDLRLQINSVYSSFRIVSYSASALTVRAVKLELGSVSTLANDVAPDYAIELAKCRASTADPSDTYANKGNLVNYADLSTIHATGSTNTTGATITNGTFFYLNGQFCKAKTNIANGATFTLNTNFEVVTVGGELANMAFHKIAENGTYSTVTADTWEYTGVSFTIPAKTFYGLRGESGWQNGRPTGLAISVANDALRTYECLALYEDANGAAYCSATGYSAANLTVYLWSKRQGTGSNPYTLNGWYVNE